MAPKPASAILRVTQTTRLNVLRKRQRDETECGQGRPGEWLLNGGENPPRASRFFLTIQEEASPAHSMHPRVGKAVTGAGGPSGTDLPAQG